MTWETLPNYAFIGVRGAGKTYAMHRMLQRNRLRYVIVDPKSEINDTFAHDDINRIIATTREYEVCPIVWHCGRMQKAVRLKGVERLTVEMCHDETRIDTLAIDEMGVVCPRQPLPDEVMDYTRMGRKFGFSLWVASQRAVDIHPDVRQLCDGLFVFRQTERNDIVRLNGILAGLGDASARLPNRYYFYVENGRVSKPRCFTK